MTKGTRVEAHHAVFRGTEHDISFLVGKGCHFCKYLLNDFSQPVDILEMDREVEMTEKKKP